MAKGKSRRISKERKKKTLESVKENNLLLCETYAGACALNLAKDHCQWLSNEQLLRLADILRFETSYDDDLAWERFEVDDLYFECYPYRYRYDCSL